MSAIPCPECGKKISSRAVICRHCGFQLGEATEQDIEVFKARKLRDRIYRLNMFSYLVIAVFIGGFAWYWIDSAGFSRMSSSGPFILMGITAIAYLVVRALLFQARRQRRAMAERRQLSNELRKNL